MTETKTLRGVEVKDADRGRALVKFAAYDEVDHHNDVTVKGAFKEGAPVLVSSYNHTSWGGSLPVGRGTIRTSMDGKSAVADLQFFMNTTAGRETFETVKATGDLQQWSYGFDIPEGGAEEGEFEGKSVRILKELQVHEISPVLRGAGMSTGTLALKRDFSAAERRRAAEEGHALDDGSFPIENEEDLRNAIRLAGHADDPAKARRHIMRRARALGKEDLIPESWRSGKSRTMSNEVAAYLMGAGWSYEEIEELKAHRRREEEEEQEDDEDDGKGSNHNDECAEDCTTNHRNSSRNDGKKPSNRGKMRMTDQCLEVVTSVKALADRAEEIVALRKSEGKAGLAESTQILLAMIVDHVKRLDALIEDDHAPDVESPTIPESLAAQILFNLSE